MNEDDEQSEDFIYIGVSHNSEKMRGRVETVLNDFGLTNYKMYEKNKYLVNDVVENGENFSHVMIDDFGYSNDTDGFGGIQACKSLLNNYCDVRRISILVGKHRMGHITQRYADVDVRLYTNSFTGTTKDEIVQHLEKKFRLRP